MKSSRSLMEFVGQVTEICGRWGHLTSMTHPWFRGQSDSSWELIPRLYRADPEGLVWERELIRDFSLRASAFLERIPSNDLELLFIMQHHGMPTRLLDWTESHLAALFFAVAEDCAETDAAVWILAPTSLNASAASGPGGRVPMSTAAILRDYVISDLDANPLVRTVKGATSLAVRPSRSTPRIVAQKGMFTIHGCDKQSLNSYAQACQGEVKWLEQILIPRKSRKYIKKELLLAGVSYSSLFPDLDGLCREIEYRYSQAYLTLDALPNKRLQGDGE
jgi:FRG domain